MGKRLGGVHDEEFTRYTIEPVLTDRDSRVPIYKIAKRLP